MSAGLDGEVAVVTGAGRGIGAATAGALARAGARVVVTARRLEDAERVAAALPGGRGLALACDVGDAGGIAAMVAQARERAGDPTILVNNAGVIAPIGPLHAVEAEAWAAGIATTLTGAALAARAVLPGMLARGGGRIVNLSSGAAHKPLEGWSAYCCAKAGLTMLTRSLATDYAGQGILAFGFAPGVVDTGMQAEIRASGINPVSRIPRESLAAVEEPAAAIAFLCTPAGDAFAGGEVDIRDAAFREAAGLRALAG
ncbi:SDR family NAD(P)-dependent oxidoreductase [Labrys wisconsinensis]|uniref:NAD(P)-dependent dehydrogenase (Short-subunit alcohol dehydrogenase family) n=1 Tax=Labrys wisconsinensis TaxID=425677 RepID=A0ABU0JJK5_9HYPH|nr:SDR family oxidoreductase [Labrys wisconsinensis]MDQ0474471.1 NAD(P)-dependent dehydrogenase (short-subunit alcohol dehydrogenase family) [Labrys wisconsinensis]